MAKQLGQIYVKSTIGGITFYKMDNTFYARTKSSLDRKRVKRDKAFRRTRWYTGRFGRASKLASAAYDLLEPEKKDMLLYRKWMGMAAKMTYSGKTETEVEVLLFMEAEMVLGIPQKTKKRNY
ncbi:MAG: hypothetical protein JST58_07105 [Bacteroidetes bacterium]|nr:hypothetical protein [Bacteroidota bacterium]